MAPDRSDSDDFFGFYRRYARTGVHAAAAALLTLFGLLASVADHWGFVAVGVAVYLLPPAYLYATRDRPGRVATSDDGTAAEPPGRPPDGDAKTGETTESASDPDATDPESTPPESAPPESTPPESEPAATGPESTDHDGRTAGWKWRPTNPPTDADLVDATAAVDGSYVAGTGGVLLARRGDDWKTVVDDGAGGDGTDFTAVDATSDGEAVWAVGDGGAVARYDVEAARLVDRSAPKDLTSTWTGVAAAGPAGEETVYLANGSGVVLRGVLVDGEVAWGEGAKPGSGSSVAALSFPTPRAGVVGDTAGDVFETTDGETFDRVGVDDPAGTLTALLAGDEVGAGPGSGDASGPAVIVADDAGALYRRDGERWTRDRPTDAALFGLAAGRRERLAVGAGGTVLIDRNSERSGRGGDGRRAESDRRGGGDEGDGWRAESTPVDATLRGVALADDGAALAVGDGGTAVERRPESAGDG